MSAASIGQLIQALSWMLLHSLWQGLLLAVLASLLLFGKKKSNVRYNILLMLFFTFIFGCLITFGWIYASHSNTVNNLSASLPPTGHPGIFDAFIANSISYFDNNAGMILIIWSVIFLFRAIHMTGVMLYVHHAKRRDITDPPEFWKAHVQLLGKNLQLKRAVKILESGYVKVPMVIGHLKPVLLMPLGLLTGLPVEQVEAVLLHELAHIRRNDYLVNLMQVVTETIFFFNPGLFWLSALLREERENCCDDLALTQTNNKIAFVKALISFKEHALYGSNYAVAFPGKKNQLVNRVGRIVGDARRTATIADKTFVISGVMLLLTIAIATISVSKVNPDAVVVNYRQAQPVTKKTTVEEITKPKAIARKAVIKHQPTPKENIGMELQQLTTTTITTMSPTAGETYATENERYALQSKKDAEQHVKDMIQAEKDQIQAQKDHVQAARDIAQAKIDIETAKKDIIQAYKDQARAQQDLLQRKRDLEMAAKAIQRANQDKHNP